MYEMEAFLEKRILGEGKNMLKSLMQIITIFNTVIGRNDGWVGTASQDSNYIVKTTYYYLQGVV